MQSGFFGFPPGDILDVSGSGKIGLLTSRRALWLPASGVLASSVDNGKQVYDLKLPPVDFIWFTAQAGGGGGGASSSGSPTQPSAGSDTSIFVDGIEVLRLGGGEQGLTNGIGDSGPSAAQLYPGSTIYGLTRYLTLTLERVVAGTGSVSTTTGGTSRFGTPSIGYGYGGNAPARAGAAGAACELFIVPLAKKSKVSVVVGSGGIRGIGDSSGTDGGHGFAIVQW